MDRDAAAWLVMAGVFALWGMSALTTGGGALLPGLLTVVALCCGLSVEVRDRFMGQILWAFSGSALRLALVVVGVALIWQIVGLELALLAAGDVLAYVEVLAAISIMSAQVRLVAAKRVVARWVSGTLPRPVRRRPRTKRTPALRLMRPKAESEPEPWPWLAAGAA
jgi:hypothetical protein